MTRIDLSKISTRAPENLEKDVAKEVSKARAERIAELQELLVAEGKHAVLIVLQGMDASGKNGAMKNVFGACSPFGLRAVGWKKPTEEEFDHDFLWRIHKQVPAKGEMVIFNRSHYEDVLVQRVHGWITEKQVDLRIDSINAFEQLLQQDANTLILKFYLHLSYEEQEEQLRERLEEPEKYYKHNDGDWREREHWEEYRAAYEDVIARSVVPWHIVPVDQRWYRNYVMTDIVVRELENLNMQWPGLETVKFGKADG